MRPTTRQRHRKAFELALFLLSCAPKSLRRCVVCKQDLLHYLRTQGRGKLRVSIHHPREDRTPQCRKEWPLCGHQKRLAHEACHRGHHNRRR